MKLTLEMLQRLGACTSARIEFERVFGKEVEVNAENAEKAISNGLLIGNGSFLMQFLNKEGRGIFLHRIDEFTHGDRVMTCPRCNAETRIFVELFNDERYRKV